VPGAGRGSTDLVNADRQPGQLDLLLVISAPADFEFASSAVVACSALGLRTLEKADAAREPTITPLAAFNDALLDALGGSVERPPSVPYGEISRSLGSFSSEARRVFAKARSRRGKVADSVPYLWADPRLCFLAPFWLEALEVDPAVVLVHGPVQGTRHQDSAERFGDLLDMADLKVSWERYNKSGLALCMDWPSLVMRSETIVSDPKTAVSEIVELTTGCGFSPEPAKIGEAVLTVERQVARASSRPKRLSTELTTSEDALSRVFDNLDGVHLVGESAPWNAESGLLDAISSLYDEEYYGESYAPGAPAYRREEEHWQRFFAGMADAIESQINPRSVLDVGCAIGMLVEALRARGVDAKGIDVSEWAIAQIPDDLRQYCRLGSVTDELEGQFDLITCIEVVEHLPPFLAEDVIGNLCRHAQCVLFSSTPDEFDELTHLNVQGPAYWTELFWRHGFVRQGEVDATFVAPHAVVFTRFDGDLGDLFHSYEMALQQIEKRLSEMKGLREEALTAHDRIAEFHSDLVARYQALHEENAISEEALRCAREDLSQSELRRDAERISYQKRMYELEVSQRNLAQQFTMLDSELRAVRETKTFRYSAGLRKVYGQIREFGQPSSPAPTGPTESSPVFVEDPYTLWTQQYDTVDDSARRSIRRRLERLDRPPLFSIVFPVYNTNHVYLRTALDSVLAQLYTNWELCVADDCSTDPGISDILAEYSSRDSRIKVKRRERNGHIVAATNTAISEARGDWVAFMDHDDEIPEHALAMMVLALADRPDAGLVYTDDDKIDPDGSRSGAYFKPDFDPLLLMGQNYLSHFCAIRQDLVDEAGGCRQGFEGSQDWDLVLRVTEKLSPEQVVHVPHVLYHWRVHPDSTASSVSAKPYARTASRSAVREHLERTGRVGEVLAPADGGPYRVRWPVPDPAPLVSIIIPTRDGRYLGQCIDSLLRFTAYPNMELIVVDNGSKEPAVLDFLRTHESSFHEGRFSVIRDESAFNYAALNNLAAEQASGEVLCLLNDDVEVSSSGWLDELVGQLMQPGIGACGALLRYEDGRVQHAGIALGIGGVASNPHKKFERLSSGYFGRLRVAHSFSAVTGACMVVRKEAWDQVSGFDSEKFGVAYNDVDFCLRLRELGWRVVWTPFAELVHHESATRGSDLEGESAVRFAAETRAMKLRWGPLLRNDPCYNPNLTLEADDLSLAWPPRVSFR